nr:D(1B) dopamine receptor-like [Lytechinus pictus]
METSNSTGLLPSNENGRRLSALRISLVCFLYLPLAGITILGNLLVFGAYRRDKRIRCKTTNTFILNLAIADLLVGVVMLINAPMYVTEKWFFGREFCIIVWAIDYLSTDMSVITIVAISVDRYLMVRNALQHHLRQSRKRIVLIFWCLWFLCSLVHTSLAFCYSARTDYKYLQNQTCNLEYRRDKTLVVLMFLIEFVLPVTCLFVLNWKVFIHIKRRGSSVKLRMRSRRKKGVASSDAVSRHERATLYRSPEVHSKTDGMLSSSDGEVVDAAEDSDDGAFRPGAASADGVQEAKSLRKSSCAMVRIHRISSSSSGCPHQKAAKLLTALLIVFTISWLPYYIYDCYVLINGGLSNDGVTQILTFILWGNSAVNPILYACANVHYRKNFLYFLHLRNIERDSL